MVKGGERHDYNGMPEWLEWRAALPAGHHVQGPTPEAYPQTQSLRQISP
jgi:hypothetical protein